MIPVFIFSGTAVRHPSLWHLPSHATAVPCAPLLQTALDCHLLETAGAPSAGGPMFCLFGLHTPWGSPCSGSCRSFLLSAIHGCSPQRTSACLRVRCGLKQVWIPSRERIRQMDSERCQMYNMTTTALHVSSSGIDVDSWGDGCQFLFTSPVE